MISVEEDIEQGIFTVIDNGMGMDKRIVSEYFSRIGLSYYKSSEFTADFSPISKFGIGILSCFMLADRIEIESKRDGSDPIQLELVTPTSPFVPRKGSRKEPGTSVRLYLKQEFIGKYELGNWARHYAKLVEVPIELVNSDASNEKISQQDPIPSIEEIADRIYERMESERWKQKSVLRYLESKNLRDYYGYTKSGGVQIGVLLIDKLFEDYEADKSHGWSVIHDGGYSSIYQDGFYVNHLRAALMGSEMTWTVVNVTGDPKFELTADRSRYAGDNLDTWRRIYSAYSEVIERLYRKFVRERKAEQWWDYHRRYYGKSTGELPSAFEKSARKESEFCILTSQGFKRCKLADVRRQSGRLFWSQQPDHEHLVLLRSLLSDQDGIVVLPAERDRQISSWMWKLTNVSPDHTLAELLRKSGATISTRYALGAEMVLIDCGHRLGPWGIPIRWPNQGWDMRAAFDARHPLSQPLLSLTEMDVPRSSALLARELFEDAPVGDICEFQELQRELITNLQGLGLLQDECGAAQFADIPREAHECPYPSSPWEGLVF